MTVKLITAGMTSVPATSRCRGRRWRQPPDAPSSLPVRGRCAGRQTYLVFRLPGARSPSTLRARGATATAGAGADAGACSRALQAAHAWRGALLTSSPRTSPRRRRRSRVMDFSASRAPERRSGVADEAWWWTPNYMSPGAARGDADMTLWTMILRRPGAGEMLAANDRWCATRPLRRDAPHRRAGSGVARQCLRRWMIRCAPITAARSRDPAQPSPMRAPSPIRCASG